MAFRSLLQFVGLSLLLTLLGAESASSQARIEVDEGTPFARGVERLRTVDEKDPSLPEQQLPGSRATEILSLGSGPVRSIPQSSDFPPPKYKTSGKEFYVVFPSVRGNESNPMNPARRSLYLTSRARTRVNIKYILRDWEQNVTTVPGEMTIVELPEWGTLNSRQFESVFDLGIKITAEDDIAVYGYSHEVLSSDGFLILPKESLGQHYVVASTRNAFNYGDYSGSSFPRSTFVIMGTEDNTNVSFRLTANSYSGLLLKDTEYFVTLNKGEVFPLFARDTGIMSYIEWKQRIDDTTWFTWREPVYAAIVPGHDPDLTGSEVKADKPIAVYCGHERAAAPPEFEINIDRLTDTATGVSRDHLTEQVPPVELWGNEFIVMGSTQDRDASRPANGDLVRVISAHDTNIVSIGGVEIDTIHSREYLAFYNPNVSVVTTSKPALVIKYAQSRKDRYSLGDPDMTIVPPVSNLSMKYTLPVVNNNMAFHEAFVNVLIHKDAVGSTKINGAPPKSRQKTIPGSDFVWYSEWGSPGEWRIESTLPCYAESYAYGPADGYTFAGGGDFTYQDSLSAENLDFKTILISKSKQLTANIKAGYDLNFFADSVTIFGLDWISGDIANFEMVDVITTPIRLGPGDKLPIRFNFTPTEVKSYRARAAVRSSSRVFVYIDVIGEGGLMSVEILPPVIDFGRVRVGNHIDTQYSVRFYGEDRIATVRLLQRSFSELATAPLGFEIKDILGYDGEGGTAYTEGIRFHPMTEGWRDTAMRVLAVLPQTPDKSDTLIVRLRGRGVEPRVVVADRDYGELRVGRETVYEDIEIRNLGSDVTEIKSIRMESGDINDFVLDAATIPSSNVFLDTTDVAQSRYRFRAKFTPKDTGAKEVKVRIETLENEVLYSTLTGRGVEPYIVAVPDTLDFGTIVSPEHPTVPTDPVMRFRITNIGTYQALVERLQQTSNGKPHFELKPVLPTPVVTNEIVAKQAFIDVDVTFLVREVGQFSDTVSVINDTENQPIVVLRARVIADSVRVPDLVLFDTVRNCDPVIDTVLIENLNSVTINIETILFGGQLEGFSFAKDFLFPITIPPGGSYPLEIQYIFPQDSLSGDQVATLTMYQMVGDEKVPLVVELHITRVIRTLTLQTEAPSFVPNVSDMDPFRLPIRIVGDHIGLPELDNFDLVLRFNNELFLPVGFDLVGSLMEGGQISSFWNEQDKTYTIRASGMSVSQRQGDLLITVLVRAKLTQDVAAVVVPELNLTQRPCAYGIEKQGTDLEYADDCGDLFLRDMLINGEQTFTIQSANPDPLVVANSSGINFNYTLATDATLECEIIDATGAVVERLEPISAVAGEGKLIVPAAQLQSSGLYTLRVYQRFEGRSPEVTVKTFRVIK